MTKLLLNSIEDHLYCIKKIKETLLEQISEIGKLCIDVIEKGNTIYFIGNGGSAADCQHLAAEFAGRFVKERKALPAIALTTDTSLLTAVGNDYSFDDIFVRQVNAFVKQGDILVGITTSGNSINILNAVGRAKEKGALTIGLTGKDGGELKDICDYCIIVPSDITARIQESHILIGHMICEMVDEVF